jgi:hypothetical protein
MEPTTTQFPAIYRKGDDEAPLKKRALQQQLGEMTATRSMTAAERYDRDVKSGVQGAKNAVRLNTTVAEATENPTMLGGPVSGAALAKEKRNKVETKKTAEREMKRR